MHNYTIYSASLLSRNEIYIKLGRAYKQISFGQKLFTCNFIIP
jgi:hypothetical protein